jgi:calcineurin-like phosphoesterase family protein
MEVTVKCTLLLTSISYLGHHNIMEYCGRDFPNVHEMNHCIISNWNNQVGQTSNVYVVGDLTMKTWHHARQYLHRLNGNIFIVPGNHDLGGWLRKPKDIADLEFVGRYPHMVLKEFGGRVRVIPPEFVVREDGQRIILSHYSMRVWHHSYRGTWHLWGHSHSEMPPHGASFDCGVDNAYKLLGKYRPFTFGEVKEQMAKLQPILLDHHAKTRNKPGRTS